MLRPIFLKYLTQIKLTGFLHMKEHHYIVRIHIEIKIIVQHIVVTQTGLDVDIP